PSHDRTVRPRPRDPARGLEPLNSRIARTTYRDAMAAAILAGGLADGTGVVEVARAMRAAPRREPPRPADLLLDSVAVMYADGYEAALPSTREALQAFRKDDTSDA